MKSAQRNIILLVLAIVLLGSLGAVLCLRGRNELAKSAITPDLPKLVQTAPMPVGNKEEAPKGYAYYRKAFECGHKKDFIGAAKEFQKVLDEYPESQLADDAQYQKAICYFALKEYEQAVEEFEKVKKNFPESYLSVRAQEWIEKARLELLRAQARKGEIEPAIYEYTNPEKPPDPRCGPASLKIACESYGIKTTEDELAKLAGTDKTGTSMYGLIKAARAKGLDAKGMQVDIEYLKRMKKPVIAWIGHKHYVVITKTGKNSVDLIDPNDGPVTVESSDFCKFWDGFVLALSKVKD